MTEFLECVICMEAIKGLKNSIVTECGHTFHANCLMKNVAHNGFDCPCCRAVMAEQLEEDLDEDDEEEYEDEDEDEEYILRGMRWLFQRANNGVVDEDEDKPSASFIAEKLLQQGTSVEDLVKYILMDHPSYDDEEEYDSNSLELFNKIEAIVSNFSSQPQPVEGPLPKEHTDHIMSRFMTCV